MTATGTFVCRQSDIDESCGLSNEDRGDIMDEKTEKNDPMAAALKARLLTLLEGDGLTPRTLLEIERTAKHGFQLLQLGSPHPRLVDAPYYSGGEMGVTSGEGVLMQSPNPFNNETFGAKIIREILDAVRTMNQPRQEPTLADQILAINIAKDRGLTAVAEKLERRMLGELSDAPEELPEAKPAAEVAA